MNIDRRGTMWCAKKICVINKYQKKYQVFFLVWGAQSVIILFQGKIEYLLVSYHFSELFFMFIRVEASLLYCWKEDAEKIRLYLHVYAYMNEFIWCVKKKKKSWWEWRVIVTFLIVLVGFLDFAKKAGKALAHQQQQWPHHHHQGQEKKNVREKIRDGYYCHWISWFMCWWPEVVGWQSFC